MKTQKQASIITHSQTWITLHMSQVSNHQLTVDLKLLRKQIHQMFGSKITSNQLHKLKSGDHNSNKISNRQIISNR
jgi:hypothetical protein